MNRDASMHQPLFREVFFPPTLQSGDRAKSLAIFEFPAVTAIVDAGEPPGVVI